MRRYRWNYGSYIVLDQCEQGHGTWLDGGEVGEMVEIMDGTVPPISPEERERIRARLAAARSEVKVRLREASRRSRESWLAYLRMIRVRGDHFLW
jgi:Zn-finger nucleic acid-binding protein